MNYFSYGFIHFSSIKQKNKFFNFVKNKELIGPHGKYIKFKLSTILAEINIGDIVSFYILVFKIFLIYFLF